MQATMSSTLRGTPFTAATAAKGKAGRVSVVIRAQADDKRGALNALLAKGAAIGAAAVLSATSNPALAFDVPSVGQALDNVTTDVQSAVKGAAGNVQSAADSAGAKLGVGSNDVQGATEKVGNFLRSDNKVENKVRNDVSTTKNKVGNDISNTKGAINKATSKAGGFNLGNKLQNAANKVGDAVTPSGAQSNLNKVGNAIDRNTPNFGQGNKGTAPKAFQRPAAGNVDNSAQGAANKLGSKFKSTNLKNDVKKAVSNSPVLFSTVKPGNAAGVKNQAKGAINKIGNKLNKATPNNVGGDVKNAVNTLGDKISATSTKVDLKNNAKSAVNRAGNALNRATPGNAASVGAKAQSTANNLKNKAKSAVSGRSILNVGLKNALTDASKAVGNKVQEGANAASGTATQRNVSNDVKSLGNRAVTKLDQNQPTPNQSSNKVQDIGQSLKNKAKEAVSGSPVLFGNPFANLGNKANQAASKVANAGSDLKSQAKGAAREAKVTQQQPGDPAADTISPKEGLKDAKNLLKQGKDDVGL